MCDTFVQSANLEISVAGENAGDDEVTFLNGFYHDVLQRSTVSNAGHASISHHAETVKDRYMEICS